MGDLRARAESLLRGPVGSTDLALAFDEIGGIDRGRPGRWPELLSSDARGHRRGVVIDPHQPVRVPAGCDRRAVRDRAAGQGLRGRDGQARGGRAGLAPGRVGPRVLRAAAGRRAWTSASCGPRGRGRAPNRRWRGRRSWTSAGSATSTTGSSSSSTAAAGGSAAPASRTTSTTAASTTSSSAVTGPVVSQLQLVFVASFRWLDGAIPIDAAGRALPRARGGRRRRSRRRCCTTRRAATARSPTPSPACSTTRARRSTWSTPTSPTGR